MTVRIRAVILGPSSGGRGPANASPDQIIGEVIIDDMVRPLGASIFRRVRRGQRRGAGTHPAASFYRLRPSSRRHRTRAMSSTANAGVLLKQARRERDSGRGSRAE